VHLGQKEMDADQIILRTLLAMWLAKPTGLRIALVARYHSHTPGDEPTLSSGACCASPADPSFAR
jgi:hypothetical protein